MMQNIEHTTITIPNIPNFEKFVKINNESFSYLFGELDKDTKFIIDSFDVCIKEFRKLLIEKINLQSVKQVHYNYYDVATLDRTK